MHNACAEVEFAAPNPIRNVSIAIGESSQVPNKAWRSCQLEDLPAYLKDNEHLLGGHRPELSSATECLKSMFRIHTETGNIWTHLIALYVFIMMTIALYTHPPLMDTFHADMPLSDKLIFLCFLVSAMLCFLFSTLYHTMACHSERVLKIFVRLDYVGIVLLIIGSSVTWLYYGFYCQYYHKVAYMIAIALPAIPTFIMIMTNRFSKPEYRAMRFSVFASLALVCAAPLLHSTIQNGIGHAIERGGFNQTLAMAALNLLGALLYKYQIPECFMPGTCDIWFQSHQIFHQCHLNIHD